MQSHNEDFWLQKSSENDSIWAQKSSLWLFVFMGPEIVKMGWFLAPEIVRKWRFLAPESIIMALVFFWPQKSSKWDYFWPQKSSIWQREPLWNRSKLNILLETFNSLIRSLSHFDVFSCFPHFYFGFISFNVFQCFSYFASRWWLSWTVSSLPKLFETH